MLDFVFRLVDVYLNQLLSNKFDHLHPQLFLFKGAGSVKGLLKNLDSFKPHFALIMTFSKSKQSDKFVLFVLAKN